MYLYSKSKILINKDEISNETTNKKSSTRFQLTKSGNSKKPKNKRNNNITKSAFIYYPYMRYNISNKAS